MPGPGSSPWRRRASTRAACLVLVLAGLAVPLAGCGKRGNPLPPIRLIPATTSDLGVIQRGNELTLDLAYPTTTVAGTALPPLESIELFEVRQPAILGKPLPSLSAQEFLGLGKSILVLRGPELASATSGDRLTVRVQMAGPLPVVVATPPPTPPPAPPPASAPAPATPPPATAPTETASAAAAVDTAAPTSPATAAVADTATTAPPAGDSATVATPPSEVASAVQKVELHTYAVRLTPVDGEPSALSNLAQIIPRQPPPPPSGLEATATATAVELVWQPMPAEGGSQGFLVYRRLAANRAWGKPLASPPATATGYRDQAASYGERYIYAVSAVGQASPLVESALSAEREIAYEDRFAPPAPTGLVALGEIQQVRLRWEASAATDVKGYLVFRQDPGADWRQLTPEPLAAEELRDSGLASGLTYQYRVQALDEVGNQGPPSDAVSVTVR